MTVKKYKLALQFVFFTETRNIFSQIYKVKQAEDSYDCGNHDDDDDDDEHHCAQLLATNKRIDDFLSFL